MTKMMTQCVLLSFCILIQAEKLLADTTCDGVDGFTCCVGFKWHEISKKCVECSPGYYGLACSNVCPYPSYGKGCKYTCNCEKKSCSPDVGCVNKTNSKEEVQINEISKRESRKQEQIEKFQFYNETYFEERLRYIIKSYVSGISEHGTIRILSFATLSSGLAIFILLVLVLVKKVAKILITPKDPNRSLSTNPDPYDHLER